MNSDTLIANASGPTQKSALKVAKEGHDGNARSAISASFNDSENEVIEVRARGYHRRLAGKSGKLVFQQEKAEKSHSPNLRKFGHV